MIVHVRSSGSKEVSDHMEFKSQINFNFATALLQFPVFLYYPQNKLSETKGQQDCKKKIEAIEKHLQMMQRFQLLIKSKQVGKEIVKERNNSVHLEKHFKWKWTFKKPLNFPEKAIET